MNPVNKPNYEQMRDLIIDALIKTVNGKPLEETEKKVLTNSLRDYSIFRIIIGETAERIKHLDNRLGMLEDGDIKKIPELYNRIANIEGGDIKKIPEIEMTIEILKFRISQRVLIRLTPKPKNVCLI